MKTVDIAEQTTAVALTRKQKLLRWSALIRAASQDIYIFHNLEDWNAGMRKLAMAAHGIPEGFTNAFTVAAADPVFRAAGLAGDSVADSIKFFELTLADMHGFSCNCGGAISKDDMANRVERLATAEPPRAGNRFTSYFQSVFGSVWVAVMLTASIGETVSRFFA